MAAGRQPVQQGRGHPFALEDLPPVSEHQIAGDQQAGPLVAVGEDLGEQFCTGAAEGQVDPAVVQRPRPAG